MKGMAVGCGLELMSLYQTCVWQFSKYRCRSRNSLFLFCWAIALVYILNGNVTNALRFQIKEVEKPSCICGSMCMCVCVCMECCNGMCNIISKPSDAIF